MRLVEAKAPGGIGYFAIPNGRSDADLCAIVARYPVWWHEMDAVSNQMFIRFGFRFDKSLVSHYILSSDSNKFEIITVCNSLSSDSNKFKIITVYNSTCV